MVSCQFSFYPLRQPELSLALDAALDAFRVEGLTPKVGAMSSYVEGDEETVFRGLRQAFQAVAITGAVVLVATVSNACAVDGPGG